MKTLTIEKNEKSVKGKIQTLNSTKRIVFGVTAICSLFLGIELAMMLMLGSLQF